MNPASLATVFNDGTKPYLAYEAFSTEAVQQAIESKGYIIVNGVIPPARIQEIREFWLEEFRKKSEGRVTWRPYLGQKNHVGYSSDTFQRLYRATDYFWNEPMHRVTREVGMRLNALRNFIINQEPLFGLRYFDRAHGVFMTVSYYPPQTGFMDMHQDSVTRDDTLIHCLAPITFLGADYAGGGMVLIDRQGNRVEVEKLLKPGDVVFYDGTLRHGVERIVGHPGSTLGRMQIMPLPTRFEGVTGNARALYAVPTSRFISAKLAGLKNAVRIALGKQPSMR